MKIIYQIASWWKFPQSVQNDGYEEMWKSEVLLQLYKTFGWTAGLLGRRVKSKGEKKSIWVHRKVWPTGENCAAQRVCVQELNSSSQRSEQTNNLIKQRSVEAENSDRSLWRLSQERQKKRKNWAGGGDVVVLLELHCSQWDRNIRKTVCVCRQMTCRGWNWKETDGF